MQRPLGSFGDEALSKRGTFVNFFRIFDGLIEVTMKGQVFQVDLLIDSK